MKRIEVSRCPDCGRSPVIDTQIGADDATKVTLTCPACKKRLGYWEIEPGEEYILSLGTVDAAQEDKAEEAESDEDPNAGGISEAR